MWFIYLPMLKLLGLAKKETIMKCDAYNNPNPEFLAWPSVQVFRLAVTPLTNAKLNIYSVISTYPFKFAGKY